jgi:predicted permease
MYRLRAFVIRLLNIFRRSRLDTDLRDQIEAHRGMIEDDLVARGTSHEEAKEAARRAVGNELLVRDFSRDEMLPAWIDKIFGDFRYACRILLRTPAFTLTVVLTLALGIGANTAIYSIVDRLLLRPLPFPNGEKLVVLHEMNPRSSRMDVNPSNWLDWQRESRSFESLAAWSSRYPMTLTGQGEPERLETESVSHEFFSILGVQPLLGRVFTPEDDRPQTLLSVVISHGLWQRKFGGDPRVVGKIVDLDATEAAVVGVMPAGFHFISRKTDVWAAFRLDRNLPWRERAGRFLPYVVGRLRPSVGPDDAQREMAGIAGSLSAIYPFNKDTSVTVIPLREVLTGEVRTSLLVLFAAVGVLLAIACSNVANLLIARYANRRREIAIRTSLGAGRGAIVRQLLIESLVLALAGGAAGVLIAKWGTGVLFSIAPASLGRLTDMTVDSSMLLYTTALSVITGVVVGLAPALPSLRFSIAEHLRNGGRSVTASLRLRQVLIVSQVAMTVVLLCGAGLLVRTLAALHRDPIGVDAKGVWSMRLELPTSRYQPAQMNAFFRQLTERLASLPGVQSASAARDIPVSTQRLSGTSFRILGQPESPVNDRPTTRVRVVTPDYFRTLGIPLLKGRDFTHEDRVGVPLVYVVNEAFVKKHFPNQDPLSASISVTMQDLSFGQIIGVVGDVKEGTLRGVPEPTVFYNYRQLLSAGLTFFVRSSRGSELAREVAQVVREMDPNLPLIEVRMLEDAFAESLARERLNAVVSGVFALCALLVASLGLYGLLAFTVAERANEIGIRMAVGARAQQVLRMVVGQGLALVTLGAALGLIAAFATSRFLESLLFGITPHDALTFCSVTALLAVVSFIAAVIPARRAARVDPIVVLRED